MIAKKALATSLPAIAIGKEKAPEKIQGLLVSGGEGGIRTHDTPKRIPDFESGAFDHSATSPGGIAAKSVQYRLWS